MTGEPMHTAAVSKERNGTACPSYINYRLKYPLRFVFSYVQSVTQLQIKNCSKITSAINITTMKNTGDFRYEGKPSRATAKSTLSAVSKDEWDTKEDTGKSMKNVLYILRYTKRNMSG